MTNSPVSPSITKRKASGANARPAFTSEARFICAFPVSFVVLACFDREDDKFEFVQPSYKTDPFGKYFDKQEAALIYR